MYTVDRLLFYCIGFSGDERHIVVHMQQYAVFCGHVAKPGYGISLLS